MLAGAQRYVSCMALMWHVDDALLLAAMRTKVVQSSRVGFGVRGKCLAKGSRQDPAISLTDAIAMTLSTEFQFLLPNCKKLSKQEVICKRLKILAAEPTDANKVGRYAYAVRP